MGRKIRELRKSKNQTQEQLSELIGINSKSLLKIENGKSFPSVETLGKIAEIFKVEISDLFVNHYLQDTKQLKKYIFDKVKNFDDKKVRSVYNFVYSISLTPQKLCE